MNYARTLRTILHGTAAVFFAASTFSSAPAAATKGLTPHEQDIVKKVRSAGTHIVDCIWTEINEVKISTSDPDRDKFARITALSDVTKTTLFERVAKDYPEKTGTDKPAWDNYCKETLFPNFREAFKKVYPEWVKQDTGGVLAKLGLEDFAHLAPFIAFFHNNFGTHTYGHTEITGDAVELLRPGVLDDYGIEITEDALWLIRSGVLATDFYGWDEEAYHAHTPDHACCDETVRKTAINTGRERYIALFRKHWDDVLSTPDERHVAFQMGILAHMIQDLMYHRGITLLQHAGLSYHVDRDPDLPPGSNKFPDFDPDTPAGKAYYAATVMTTQMLQALIDKMPIGLRKRALTWKGRKTADIDSIAVAAFTVGLFPGEVDDEGKKKEIKKLNEIGVALSMMDYYSRASIYKSGDRNPAKELSPTTAENRFGLINWPIGVITDGLYE